jgi:hypothetical protein
MSIRSIETLRAMFRDDPRFVDLVDSAWSWRKEETLLPALRRTSTIVLAADAAKKVGENVGGSSGDAGTGGGSTTVTSLPWNSVTDKPVVFPPEDHTHTIPDVAGLQGALDGKEPFITPGTVTQYLRGDKTWASLDGAIDTRISGTWRGASEGLASLVGGKVPLSQLPATTIVDTYVVGSEGAMLALVAQQGDVAVRTDLSKTFILKAEPATTLGNWQEILAPTGSVTSVFGRTGAVTALAADYSAFYQPLDSDLTAIAALITTPFGRSLLTYSDATSLRAGIDAQATIATATTSDYYRGDKTWQNLGSAIDSRISSNWRGFNNGLASLDGTGKIPFAQLPTIPVTLTATQVGFGSAGNTLTGAAGLTYANGVLRVGEDGQGTARVRLSTSAGQFATYGVASDGSLRWTWGKENTAEPGSNGGSRFVLNAIADDGVTTIDSPINIARAAGGTMFLSRPVSFTNQILGRGSRTAIGRHAEFGGSNANNAGIIGFARGSDGNIGADMGFLASETESTEFRTNVIGNNSAFMTWYLRNAANTAGREVMRLHNSGGLSVGNTTDPGAGGLRVTGKAIFAASVTDGAGLNVGGTGVAPTAPVDGDVWRIADQAYIRMGANTREVILSGPNQTIGGLKTFQGIITLATPGTSGSLNFPSAAGTSTTAGHVWRNGDNLLFRDSTATRTLFHSGNLTVALGTNAIPMESAGLFADSGLNVQNIGTADATVQVTNRVVSLRNSTTTRGALNFASNAPSAPFVGDMWRDVDNLRFRDTTANRTLLHDGNVATLYPPRLLASTANAIATSGATTAKQTLLSVTVPASRIAAGKYITAKIVGNDLYAAGNAWTIALEINGTAVISHQNFGSGTGYRGVNYDMGAVISTVGASGNVRAYYYSFFESDHQLEASTTMDTTGNLTISVTYQANFAFGDVTNINFIQLFLD